MGNKVSILLRSATREMAVPCMSLPDNARILMHLLSDTGGGCQV